MRILKTNMIKKFLKKSINKKEVEKRKDKKKRKILSEIYINADEKIILILFE